MKNPISQTARSKIIQKVISDYEKDGWSILYNRGEPCSDGCLQGRPCQNCDRVEGDGIVFKKPMKLIEGCHLKVTFSTNDDVILKCMRYLAENRVYKKNYHQGYPRP
jgi:hypothetical protein